MNIASIDIGSNTVILLIAKFDKRQKQIITLENHYSIPRIGKDLHITGKISEDKINDLLQILNDYKKIAAGYNCKQILLVATKAFRDTQNAKSIISVVKKELGLNIQIISGEQEAYFSFIGAISDFPKNQNYYVIDIGGGSTEIIYGENKEIKFKRSFNLGVIKLRDIIYKSSSIDLLKFDNLYSYIDQHINNIAYNSLTDFKAISVAGTPSTIASMIQRKTEFDEKAVDKFVLSKNSIENLITEFDGLAPEQILIKYGPVVKGREDLILGGSILLNRILKCINASEVTVSTRGLRYGVILDYFYGNPTV